MKGQAGFFDVDERLQQLLSFDQNRAAGYIAMSGQIVDASLVAAPSSVTPMPRRRRSRLAASA